MKNPPMEGDQESRFGQMSSAQAITEAMDIVFMKDASELQDLPAEDREVLTIMANLSQDDLQAYVRNEVLNSGDPESYFDLLDQVVHCQDVCRELLGLPPSNTSVN